MSLSQVLAIFAIVVPCVTALLVAYWHRKQMRQIELFRQNPEAGLVAADSKFYRFVKARRQVLLGIFIPILGLILELSKTEPVTRYTIIFVSVYVSSILFSIQLYFQTRTTELIDKVVTMLGRHTSLFETQTEMTEVHTSIIKSLLTAPEQDVERLTSHRPPSNTALPKDESS